MGEAPAEFLQHCQDLARRLDKAVPDPQDRAEIFKMIETLVNTPEWDRARMLFVTKDDLSDLEGLF